MILGLGSDICDIRRIEKVIARHGERFLERVFTETERAKAKRRTEKIQASTYAKRFAAKEAASKALGTGFRQGVFFSDLGGEPAQRATYPADDRRRGRAARGDHTGRDAGDGGADDDRRVSVCLRAGDHFGGAMCVTLPAV